ncbi:MAG: hypothetical protein WA639_06140 [Candidatus Acidiferrum sp.]
MSPESVVPWIANWAWALPLIILTVIFHAAGLGLIGRRVSLMLSGTGRLRNLTAASIVALGSAALSATVLHALEGFIWAETYRLIGALQGNKSAMLYSLNAMTSYGHENLELAPGWQMMGALEALNGWILFGLTTAFLFSVMQNCERTLKTKLTKQD